MSQSGNTAKPDKKDNSAKTNDKMNLDDLPSDENNIDSSQDAEHINPEALAVTEEITELLSKENIVAAVQKFKADSEEKETAVEFTNAHIQFLSQIVESDYKHGVSRTDVEIRDLVSHVNMMLRKRDEYLFTTMIMHSPSHYRTIQNKFYSEMKKEENEK